MQALCNSWLSASTLLSTVLHAMCAHTHHKTLVNSLVSLTLAAALMTCHRDMWVAISFSILSCCPFWCTVRWVALLCLKIKGCCHHWLHVVPNQYDFLFPWNWRICSSLFSMLHWMETEHFKHQTEHKSNVEVRTSPLKPYDSFVGGTHCNLSYSLKIIQFIRAIVISPRIQVQE